MTPPGPRLLATLVLSVLCLAGCAKPEVGLADGGGASWSQWRGHWLVINYWAEWCAPCRKEIPELNRFYHDGKDRDVVVLGVNFDNLQGDELRRLIDKMGIEFPVLVNDPGPRWNQDRPTVLPSTLVIDPEGKLERVLVGPQTYDTLSQAVHLTEDV